MGSVPSILSADNGDFDDETIVIIVNDDNMVLSAF